MNQLAQDLRYGLRVLLARPGFTAIAVLTLALGIAATTSIFSVVDAVLLRQLPFSEPSRVVIIHNQLPKLSLPRTQVSAPQYADYTNQSDAFESTAAITGRNFNLTGTGIPEQLLAGRVTASFFPMLGVTPVAGRFFNDEEDKFGNQHVAVLSAKLWKRMFNSDEKIIGTNIQLDGESYQIVGVAPAGFEELYANYGIWIPMAFSPSELSADRRWSLAYTMLARLKPGTTINQAQAMMRGVAEHTNPDNLDDFNIEVRSYTEEKLGDLRKPLLILLCAVGVVLLISCANIASLLLARAGARTNEMAIRTALGASRSRLVRQLLTESVLLAVIGEALGVLLAWWSMSALIALAPPRLPRLSEVRLNAGVLLFSLGVSLACGVLVGLMPALLASRANLANALKGSGRTESASPVRHRLLGGLVIAEVALAMVLLVSGGLLLRSFQKVLDVRPGFDPHNVLTLRTSLPRAQYPNSQRVADFYNAVLEKVSALPGVQHTAAAYQPPFTPGGDNSVFSIRDRHAAADDPAPHADYAFVTSDYFQAMGVPLLSGRYFESSDMRTGNYFGEGSAAIIDEELAKRFWPNGDAVGGGISWSDKGPWATIVGIVATVQPRDLTEQSKGAFYLPTYFSAATFVVRTSNDPKSLATAIRDQVLAVDKSQPIYDIQTMEERVARSVDERRFAVLLLAIFAGCALLLAAIGLYGVLSSAVTQRTREIGIRIALGAPPAAVLKQVVGKGMLLTGLGIAIGLAAALAVTRVMTSLLFEVSATDPLTFVLIVLILTGAALAACFVPARRATRIDPMAALRCD